MTAALDWADDNSDWDLYIFRKEGSELVEVARSASGALPGEPNPREKAVVPNPTAGEYVVRVVNYTAQGTYRNALTFTQRSSDPPRRVSAAYVGFCGYCEPLINRAVRQRHRHQRRRGRRRARRCRATAGTSRAPQGLPRRYITSVQVDPADPRTVYVTLGGYSRRWVPVGALGEETRDVGTGHVFKSTDAGETFTDISGDLPDVPANFTAVRAGQLMVATDVGVVRLARHERRRTTTCSATGCPRRRVHARGQAEGLGRRARLADRRDLRARRVALPVRRPRGGPGLGHQRGRRPARSRARRPTASARSRSRRAGGAAGWRSAASSAGR